MVVKIVQTVYRIFDQTCTIFEISYHTLVYHKPFLLLIKRQTEVGKDRQVKKGWQVAVFGNIVGTPPNSRRHFIKMVFIPFSDGTTTTNKPPNSFAQPLEESENDDIFCDFIFSSVPYVLQPLPLTNVFQSNFKKTLLFSFYFDLLFQLLGRIHLPLTDGPFVKWVNKKPFLFFI